MPDLTKLVAPVAVQIGNTAEGACWRATYSSPKKHDAGQFKAKAD